MFANVSKQQESEGSSKEFKKVNYIRFDKGKHVFRILDDHATDFFQHFVHGRYPVKCIGDGCPICENNFRIMTENPDTFRDVQGFLYRQHRYVFNVLDRTDGRRCPNCGKAVKDPSVAGCPACKTILLGVESGPLNEVGLFTCGPTIAQTINDINEIMSDAGDAKIAITDFDIVATVTGSGLNKTTSLIPAMNRMDDVKVPSDELFDHESCVISLSATEISDLLRGVQLKDIFSARKGSASPKQEPHKAQTTGSSTSKISPEKAQEIADKLLLDELGY